MDPQELFDGNRGLAYRVANQLGRDMRNVIDREALLNSCLFALHRAAKAYRPELGYAFSTLATHYIRNAGILHVRHHFGGPARLKFTQLTELTAEGIPARDESAPTELPPAVREALARLDARCRQALLARCGDGKTLERVGAEMNLTGERVRQLVKLAITSIRKRLATA